MIKAIKTNKMDY